jgi:hypothetical protein
MLASGRQQGAQHKLAQRPAHRHRQQQLQPTPHTKQHSTLTVELRLLILDIPDGAVCRQRVWRTAAVIGVSTRGPQRRVCSSSSRAYSVELRA